MRAEKVARGVVAFGKMLSTRFDLKFVDCTRSQLYRRMINYCVLPRVSSLLQAWTESSDHFINGKSFE
jgi:hypothetical protein